MIAAEVQVVGAGMENKMPVVVLAPVAGRGILPMRIGSMEALSILIALEEKEMPRPLTHDLFTEVLEEWDVELEQVVIIKIEDDIFYAELVMRKGGKVKRIDSRPSDGLALALRKNAPIYISEELAEEGLIYIDASEFVDEYELKDFNL